MSDLPQSKDLRAACADAITVLKERAGPLIGLFAFLHALMALPGLAWTFGRSAIADMSGGGQDFLFALVGDPSTYFYGAFALAAGLVFLVVIYTYVFAAAVGVLGGKTPSFSAMTASLAVFGLLALLPYVAFGLGIGSVLIPLARGAAFEWGMLLPLAACLFAGIVSGIIAQPLFYCAIATGATSNAYGMSAFRQALEVVRRRFGEYALLALLLVAITIAFVLFDRLLNAFIPSPSGGGLGDLFASGGVTREAVWKTLIAGSPRPVWATWLTTAIDVLLNATHEAYVCVLVTLWYGRKAD